ATLWDGVPPEAVNAALHAWSAAGLRTRGAAEALLAAAGGRHLIEESAKVYLRLDAAGRWAVDPLTMDGDARDGYRRGATNEACECDDEVECDAVCAAADMVRDVPSGPELAVLLTAAL